MLLLTAVKRAHVTWKDLNGLLFMFAAPLLYLLNPERIKSPIGHLLVGDRETLRSFVYGFFKTHFFYIKDLKVLSGRSHYPVVVDVGANIGDFALGTASLAGKVVAVEPGSKSFSALETNIEANNLDNVVPLNLAANDKEEELFMHGNASDMFVAKDKNGQPVKGLTLDQIAETNGLDDIDVLKIDVQGHEMSVLLGMHQLLLGKSVKFLIVEVHLKRGVQVEEVTSLMEKYGYQLIHSDDYLFDQPHLYFAPVSDTTLEITTGFILASQQSKTVD